VQKNQLILVSRFYFMKIIIDKNIPFICGVFENVAEVQYLPNQEINNQTVKDADVLIIRTRTLCNEQLLKNTKVRFIATATAGSDHIDFDFCRKNNIEIAVAAGCNARSVAQYVGAAIGFWLNIPRKERKGFTQRTQRTDNKNFALFAYPLRSLRGIIKNKKLTIGIVGYGHVGKEVEKVAKLLNFNILLNDPPLQKATGDKKFVSLQHIAENADIITFHTPLTFDGEFPTKNLADKFFFETLKRKPLIINTARGGVVDETELLKAYKNGKITDFVIDCWENEPQISHELLQNALIATPHIAGYSADGKANATKMSVRAVAEFFGFGGINLPQGTQRKHKEHKFITNFAFFATKLCVPCGKKKPLQKLLLENYNIAIDSENLKSNPQNFEFFRNNYPERREIDYLLL